MTAGEQARWIALYAELERPLFNVVYRVVWDAAESQDVVQEAFLRCWKRRERIRDEGLGAVLYRTALNLAINRRRRQRLWRFVGLDAVEQMTVDEPRGDAAMPQRFRRAIESLPDRFRRVLLLTELAGMTYGEVAMILGINEGTVGSRRTRALKLLRQALDPDSATALPEHGEGGLS